MLMSARLFHCFDLYTAGDSAWRVQDELYDAWIVGKILIARKILIVGKIW